MALVDQYGNPIKRNELLEEQATPSMFGVRNILSSSVTAGLNPGRLANILRSADDGDIEAYLAMAEELEEKDPHYQSVLGTRKRAVAQMDITVEAASTDAVDEENAQLIRDWLGRDQLEGEFFDMLDALGKGFSVTEIMWDTTADVWLPKDLVWRDPRWFQFDRVDGTTVRLREQGSINGVDLRPYKFIIHRTKAKSGLTVRGGLARTCAWPFLFKNFSVKDWVVFCEAYGQPIRVGKYGPGATEKDRDILLRAVANIGSDAAAIIPESMIIEFVEAQNKGNSTDAFERLATFCDKQMSKAVIGQTTTADAAANGLAGNQAHNDVRGDISRSDAKQLAATLNQQLIPAIINLNKGIQKKYPRIRIGEREIEDIEKLALASDKAVRLGMRISEKRLREKMGLPAPEGDDDILRPEPTPMPSPIGAVNQPITASAVAPADQGNVQQYDAIDRLSHTAAADWETVMGPIVAQIEQVMQESTSYADLVNRLLDLTEKLKMDPLTEAIAKTMFAARLAGNLDADIGNMPNGRD